MARMLGIEEMQGILGLPVSSNQFTSYQFPVKRKADRRIQKMRYREIWNLNWELVNWLLVN